MVHLDLDNLKCISERLLQILLFDIKCVIQTYKEKSSHFHRVYIKYVWMIILQMLP